MQQVRRGPRNYQRRVYLHLKQKSKINPGRQDILSSSINLELPTAWNYEFHGDDSASFFRRERVEFNGQRVILELIVDMSVADEGLWSKFKVRSHGFQADLKTILGSEVPISELHLEDQIVQAIHYLENSPICRGIPLQDDESIISLNPHLTGEFLDLNDPEHKTENRAFSKKCQVISTGTGTQCRNCKELKKVNNQRKSRKEKRSLELPAANSNKRFISHDEVVEQLKEESRKRKNAENREKYWKDKFASEALELDKDDQTDLIKIFSSVKTKDVPADMLCLWEQQGKILQSSSPQGYRWHPKYV